MVHLRLQTLATSTLLRTSLRSTVFLVPYHLSTVHLVLTAKWLVTRDAASKIHDQHQAPGAPGCHFRTSNRQRAHSPASSSLRADTLFSRAPRRVHPRPTQ